MFGKGIRGSFGFGYGLNIRESNTLKCNQKLKKDSSTTVTDLPLTMFRGSDGKIYAFGDTGKIYRKASGTWALAYTEAGGKITGACEFASTSGKYILYATQTKLRKITLANAGGTWTGNVSDAGTFSEGAAATLHTMRVALGVVLINDGNVVAEYDYADAFNATALRLSSGKLTNTLMPRGAKAYFGTVGDGIPEGWVVDWDRLADSWISEKSAQGNGVNMMGPLELGMILQAGSDGKLKYFNLTEVSPLMQIPDTGTSKPGAVAEYNTITHFGMNGGSKNGVYSLGRLDKNDPIALNLEYIPSHGKLTGTDIGALCADGTDLYVSWKDGSTYGIDITDSANKASAVYESIQLDMNAPEQEKIVRHVKITLAEGLPASCKVGLKYRATRDPEDPSDMDADGWVVASMADGRDELDATGETKGIWDLEAQGEIYETKITLTPAGNLTPEVTSVSHFFNYDNSL